MRQPTVSLFKTWLTRTGSAWQRPPVRDVGAMPSWSCGSCPVWQESGRDDVMGPGNEPGRNASDCSAAVGEYVIVQDVGRRVVVRRAAGPFVAPCRAVGQQRRIPGLVAVRALEPQCLVRVGRGGAEH